MPAPTQQDHKPRDDLDCVFCYVAPRSKPNIYGDYLVFIFSRGGVSTVPGTDRARPFDSGGIRRCFPELNAEQIKGLVENLTFGQSWWLTMGMYVARLFDSYDSYERGKVPCAADPLNLEKSDRWNFTWELLTREELQISGRLVGVLEVRSGNGSQLSQAAVEAVNDKHVERRLIYKRIDRSQQNPDEALLNLYRSSALMPGW